MQKCLFASPCVIASSFTILCETKLNVLRFCARQFLINDQLVVQSLIFGCVADKLLIRTACFVLIYTAETYFTIKRDAAHCQQHAFS
ncbi:7 transmembrane receptor [Trichinella spiralis]|uniref:7 transmembrane receptor n=1 Tax=Trichinella spiralis TaxID=6334 RepID=UPI0001EFE3C2|nr:7 transmembrane receptor [Trichinella spiralis]